jgi:P27 family predicted phage terminase small subunit
MGKGRSKETYKKEAPTGKTIADIQEGKPRMPTHLGAIAKKEFVRLVKLLSETVVMNEADGNALGKYCCAFERWVLAEENIATEGLTVAGPNQMVRQNPCVQIAAEAIKTMERIGKDFGLTPGARKKLAKSDEPKAEKDEFNDFESEWLSDEVKDEPTQGS